MSDTQKPIPHAGLFHKLHIAFKYAAILSFAVSLYNFLSSSWLLYKAERIPGTVTDIVSHTSINRKSGVTSTSYTPVFEFRYQGEILHHEATYGSGIFTYRINEQEEILVDPLTGTVKANSFMELWFLSLMLAGVGAFFTLFAVVIPKIARVYQRALSELEPNGVNLKTNKTQSSKQSYTVNGKVYDRLEDVPEKFR